MKNLFILIGLLVALAFPDTKITGQGNLQSSLVTWTTGANTGKTRIRLYTGNTYLDTSTTGQAGSWKRIDNTSDSCSVGFLLASDTNGSVRPIWEYRVWELSKAINALSSHVFRVQTKEKVPNNTTKVPFLTPWTVKGMNNGYSDVVVQDSVLMAATRAHVLGTKVSQYSYFMAAGSLARFCPDEIGSTSTSAGDSIIIDSIRVWTR